MADNKKDQKGNGPPNSAGRLVRAVDHLGLVMEQRLYRTEGVKTIRVRGPLDPGDEYLIVVRADADDGTPMVGFHSGVDLASAFIGLANRLRNGTLKWHMDEYANK